MHVIETTKKSLDALANLDYPNYELIVVDTGSTDGSAEEIEKYLTTEAMQHLRRVFVELNLDVGPIDGENAAYRLRDKSAKYVALAHSDVLPRRDYLRNLVGYMEEHEDVGATQGIVTRVGNARRVDSSGFMLDEALNLYALHENSNLSLTKPVYISFVEATLAVYNVQAIEKVLKSDIDLFIPGGFMNYLEDVFVSIMLWSSGYQSVLLPIVTGQHLRMATTGKYVQPIDRWHYRLRNQIALLYATNSTDKVRFILQTLRRAAVSKSSLTFREMMLKSLIEGVRIGRQLKEKYGTIDLYQTPLRKSSISRRLHL